MKDDLLSRLKAFDSKLESALNSIRDNFSKIVSPSSADAGIEYNAAYTHAEISTYETVRKLLHEDFPEISCEKGEK